MNKKIILTFLIIAIVLPVFGMFKLPRPEGYVNDFANVIADSEKAKLNSIILELKQKTGAEVIIVTLGSLQGYPIEDVGLEIGRQWKVGQKGKNNGVIILVAPNEREMRIETGYGVEGAIPDSKAGRIRDNYMIPHFKTGEYGKGTILGTAAIIDAIAQEYGVTVSGNYTYRNYKAENPNHDQSNPLFNFIFFAIFLFFAIRHPRLMLFLLLTSGRGGGRSHSGGFGGFSGGGGFGGGGASGRW